jgi:uncharacterized protein YhjY with autotransporter beta-barrel domain
LPYQPLTHKEVNVHRYALLSLLAGSFFSSRVISSLRAVNVGSGSKEVPLRTHIFSLLFLIAGVLFSQSVQAQTFPVDANGPDAVISAPTGPFDLQGDVVPNALLAQNGGTINGKNGSTLTLNISSSTIFEVAGLNATGLKSLITFTPGQTEVNINMPDIMPEHRYRGVWANNGGTVILTNATVDLGPGGPNGASRALEAAFEGSGAVQATSLTATGTTIIIRDKDVGAFAFSGASLTLQESTMLLLGSHSFGILSNAPGNDDVARVTPINVTGTTISVKGNNNFIVYAFGPGATITIGNQSTVTLSSGTNNFGLLAQAGGEIDVNNSTVSLMGSDNNTALVDSGSVLKVVGGSTISSGANGIEINDDFSHTLGPDTVMLTNSKLNSAADAFHLTSAVADITVNGSSITSGNGVLLNSIGSTGTFNIENSTLTGNILADSASTMDVNLLDNSTLTAVINGAHNVFIDPSTWIMPNDSSITGNLALAGNLIINSAAKFAATGQASVLTIGGNFTMRQGSTLSLGIGGLLPKQYDRVQVGGNAILSGNLVVSSLNGFHPSAGNAFLVLRTNGMRLGNFSQLNDSAFNNNPSISAQLRPVDVELVAPNGIVLVYLKPTSPSPRPPIIDLLPELLPPLNPDEPISKEEVVQLLIPNVEQMTALYEIGFSAANMQRFNLGDRMFQIQQGMTGFVSPITPSPLPAPTGKEITEGKGVEGKAPPPAQQPGPTNRWGIWANGWGDFVHLDSTSAAQGYNFTTGGMSAGVDYLITDHFAVGLFGGYSHTWVNFNSSGSADVNTGRGGLYATYFQQGWWINAAVWGGGNSYSTSRQALAGQANGETDGWELSTFGDAGYDFHCGDLSFGPTVSMQYTDVHVSGFGENGSMLPLNIHGDSQDSLRTDVGGQAYYRWHVGNIPVIPNVRLAWEHEYFYSALPITATAPALDGATATFSGPNEGHDSLIINANIAVQWTPRIWTTIGYDGQCARDHYNSNAVTGTFSFSF